MGALLGWRPPWADEGPCEWKAGLWDPAGCRGDLLPRAAIPLGLGGPAAPGRGAPPQVGGEGAEAHSTALCPAPRERQEQLMGYRKRGPKPKPLVVQVRRPAP